jgi:SnoaL-like domain
MSEQEKTWETYVASWRTTSVEHKRDLFRRSLAADCVYADPLAEARGWQEILSYMETFHQQAPGNYFSTVEISGHHGRSIARWEMRDAQHRTLGDGIGYGEYNEEGLLVSVSNFFKTP